MHSANDYCYPEVEDQQRRQRRLEFLDISACDREIAQRLQEYVVKPHLEPIIATFYDRLTANQEFRDIMAQGFDIEVLRQTQSDYLLTLGVDFASAAYFDRRIRVGLVHERVGVPLSLYQCAFCMVQQLLFDHISIAVRDPTERERLRAFALQITTLAMSLAIEAYHSVRMESLQGSLQKLGAQERKQRELAQTDVLTGLASRARFSQELAEALAGPANGQLCLAIADLDFFKQVNDRYGHLAGDAVLREVGARLRAGFRDFDLVARYGGEEFVIILDHATRRQAVQICERVRQRISATPVAGLQIPITVSFGIARMVTDDSPETLFERADRALYAAKNAGRNRVRSEADAGWD